MNADCWLTYLTTLADSRFGVLYSKGALGREALDVKFLDMQIAGTPAHQRGSMQERWTQLLRGDQQTTNA